MNYIILSLIAIPFLYFNYKIIESDIRDKLIPNKYLIYLIYLLPFFYLNIFYSSNLEVNNHLIFFWQIFLSIFICFIIYYFWIWWAGDAKYLLVLALFLSHIWFFQFIWNIAILVIIYLWLYFLYFYFWKCLIKKNYAKNLYNNIYIDLKDKFLIFIKHNDWHIYKKTSFKIILNRFLIFLFIFVWFRLIRLIFVQNFISNKDNISDFWEIMIKYNIYIWIIIFSIFWIVRYYFMKLFILFKNLISKVFNIKYDKTKLLFPILLFIILLSFIIIEYNKNPYEILKYLKKIFTLYISIYIIIKILIYSYKLTFQISETQYIEIQKLEKWEIIDKNYLIKMFWEQSCLGGKNKIWILAPDPKQYFLKISNPIDDDTVQKLKEIYNIVINYHTENKTPNYEKNDKIKILMTFAFAPYILVWFFLTFFFQNKIFDFINTLFIDFIKSIYN